MNKEQIIDEVHQNYVKETMFDSNPKWLESVPVMDMKTGEKSMGAKQYDKESFINKCKTDSEFSEKWGLKIEEQELTYSERWFLKYNETFEEWMNKLWEKGEIIIPRCSLSDEWTEQGIPTKLITITYKDTIIESYE